MSEREHHPKSGDTPDAELLDALDLLDGRADASALPPGLQELQGLAGSLRDLPRVPLPSTLRGQVLGAVPWRSPGTQGKFKDWFHRNLGASAWLPGRVMATARGRCNWFFYFVGLLHLGMGLVMQAGLAGHAALLPAWVQQQPVLACALGLLLMCLGVLARSQAQRLRLLARWGVGLYVAAALVNSLGLMAFFRAEGVVLAAAALAGCGLIMGSFLGTVLLTCTGGKHHA